MKLKNLFNYSLLIISLHAYSQDKSETILFMDLNNNPKEIAVAKKIAKEKGMNVIVIPNGEDSKEISLEDQVKEVLNTNKVSSLVLSGHNGGSGFSGDKGSIEVGNIISILEESSSKEAVSALYLLGCNAANKTKIFFWKAALPSLKFIAGYDGTAPLGNMQSGLVYFEDALKKQKDIAKTSDEAKIKNMLSSLKFVNSHETSVYVCTPDDKEFLQLAKRSGSERFGKFDTAECSSKVKDFQTKYQKEIKTYWLAEKEPTALSPSSGFLKDAYVFMRQNEHCFKNSVSEGYQQIPSPDSLLFLRFNKDFNKSLVDYYRPFFIGLEKELKQMLEDPDSFISDLMKKNEDRQSKLKFLKDNPKELEKIANVELQKVQKDLEKLFQKHPGLRECINSQHGCERFQGQLDLMKSLNEVLVVKYSYERVSELNSSLDMLVNGYAPNLASYKSIMNADEIQEIHKNVLKILSSSDVSRKDLLALTHSLNGLHIIGEGNLATMRRVLEQNDSLDSLIFPFSWHERIPTDKVEDPVKSYQLEELKFYQDGVREDAGGYLKRYVKYYY